jgi:SAM-dependent methyltransferase
MARAPKSWEDTVLMCMTDPTYADLARAAYFLPPVEAGKRYYESAEYAEVRRNIPGEPGRALDLGAGNGILSYALARDGWDVTAVEPDPSDLIGAGAIRALAAQTATPITVLEAYGESIPLEAANFDLIVARQVLHHAMDLPCLCQEMARLCRHGATIVTLRDHVITDASQLPAFLDQHPLHRFYGGENAFTLDAYRASLTGAGLSIRKEWRSFQSVVNFDPSSEEDVRHSTAALFGPLRAVFGLALAAIPFRLLAKLLSIADRRPGRLVSFVAIKEAQ